MPKILGRYEFEYVPIDQISSIHFNKGLISGRIHITVVNDEKVIKRVNNYAGLKMVELIEKQIDQIKSANKSNSSGNADPLQALKMRLVNGEITIEQYEELRRILER